MSHITTALSFARMLRTRGYLNLFLPPLLSSYIFQAHAQSETPAFSIQKAEAEHTDTLSLPVVPISSTTASSRLSSLIKIHIVFPFPHTFQPPSCNPQPLLFEPERHPILPNHSLYLSTSPREQTASCRDEQAD